MKLELRSYPAVFPVPVILLSVYDEKKKVPNIITLAWVGNVCSNPPMVGVSIRPARYSYELVKSIGEFCLNIPTVEQIEKVDYCGTVSGRDHNKFEDTGFTSVRGSEVNAPYIEECPVNIECKLNHQIQLGTHDLFIAESLLVHIDEEYLEKNRRRPDYKKIDPLAYCPEKYFSIGKELGKYGWSKAKREEK